MKYMGSNGEMKDTIDYENMRVRTRYGVVATFRIKQEGTQYRVSEAVSTKQGGKWITAAELPQAFTAALERAKRRLFTDRDAVRQYLTHNQ